MVSTDNDALPALMLDRAEAELRRGQGLLLTQNGKAVSYLFPAEFMDAELWHLFSGNQPVLVDAKGETPLKHITIMALADLCYGSNRPASAHALPASAEIIRLAKQAGILPVFIALPPDVAPSYTIDIAAETLQYPPALQIIQGDTVQLPIEGMVESTLTSFRTRYGSSVHLALCVGDWQNADSPLVRVHSSCVTGDILGSLRCDCGDQLKLAISRIKQEGAGILLYLHQEGRGIGIHSKLRSYRLQEQGLDTFDANTQLGYEEDERDYSIANAMLTTLGVTRIRLLTNNPDKIAALESSGITVAQRIPLVAGAGEHNQLYLTAKAKKHGHLF